MSSSWRARSGGHGLVGMVRVDRARPAARGAGPGASSTPRASPSSSDRAPRTEWREFRAASLQGAQRAPSLRGAAERSADDGPSIELASSHARLRLGGGGTDDLVEDRGYVRVRGRLRRPMRGAHPSPRGGPDAQQRRLSLLSHLRRAWPRTFARGLDAGGVVALGLRGRASPEPGATLTPPQSLRALASRTPAKAARRGSPGATDNRTPRAPRAPRRSPRPPPPPRSPSRRTASRWT